MRYDSIASVNHDPGSPWMRYGKSKLCNIFFARPLASYIAQRVPDARIVSTVCHPGGVRTELHNSAAKSYPWAKQLLGALVAVVNVSPYKGAIRPLYLATAASAEEGGDSYYVPYAKRLVPEKIALSDGLAGELWKLSVEIVEERLGSLEL